MAHSFTHLRWSSLSNQSALTRVPKICFMYSWHQWIAKKGQEAWRMHCTMGRKIVHFLLHISAVRHMHLPTRLLPSLARSRTERGSPSLVGVVFLIAIGHGYFFRGRVSHWARRILLFHRGRISWFSSSSLTPTTEGETILFLLLTNDQRRGSTKGREGRGSTTGREGRGSTKGREGRGSTKGREGRGSTKGREGRGSTKGREGRGSTTGGDEPSIMHQLQIILLCTYVILYASAPDHSATSSIIKSITIYGT